MLICAKCGVKGGAGILGHVFIHIVDLAVAAVTAAVVSGATVGKLGWPGILIGAVMGMGLGAFRERVSRRRPDDSGPGGSDPSTPSAPVG